MSTQNLHYQEFGDSSGLPVFFIHGLGAHSQQISSFLAPLAEEKGFRLITPDMPGHGLSVLEKGFEYSFNFFVTQIRQLIEDLGLNDFILGGLSMGSALSLAYTLHSPEKVQKLVVLRPSWIDSKQPTHLEIVAKVGRWIQEKGIQEAQGMLQQAELFRSLSPYATKVKDSILGLFNRPQAHTAADVLYKMWEDRPFENIESLEKIKVPSLVLSSPRDPLHPVSIADLTAKHLKGSISKTLPSRYDEPTVHTQVLVKTIQEFIHH